MRTLNLQEETLRFWFHSTFWDFFVWKWPFMFKKLSIANLHQIIPSIKMNWTNLSAPSSPFLNILHVLTSNTPVKYRFSKHKKRKNLFQNSFLQYFGPKINLKNFHEFHQIDRTLAQKQNKFWLFGKITEKFYVVNDIHFNPGDCLPWRFFRRFWWDFSLTLSQIGNFWQKWKSCRFPPLGFTFVF